MKKSSIFSYFKLGDFITVAFAVTLAIFLTIAPRTGENEGKPKRLYLYHGEQHTPLSWRDATFSIYEITDRQMIVEVLDGKARIISSSCPDKVCVHTGWVERCGDIAACLPNGVALMVSCEDDINVTKP